MFKKGDKVQLSAKGIKWGVLRQVRQAARRGEFNPIILGTVVSMPRDPKLVRVLRDGFKTSCSYHASFWDKK